MCVQAGVVSWAACRRWRWLSGSTSAFAQKKYDDGATDTEIKIGNTNPYSGPASSYGRDRQDDRRLLQERSTTPAASTAARSSSSRSTTATARPRRSRWCASWSSRTRSSRSSSTLGTPSNTAIHKYMNQKKVPQLFVATGASKWGDPKELPVDHGLPARLPHRGGDLRQAHPGQRQGCQDRRAACRTTTTASDYLDGFKEGLGKEAGRIVKHRDLRGDRSDGRQPDHPAQGFRRQRLLQHLGAQGRGAGASARRPRSAGSRRTTSTTCRPRSPRS